MKKNTGSQVLLVVALPSRHDNVGLLLRAGGTSWSTIPFQPHAELESALAEARGYNRQLPVPLLVYLDDLDLNLQTVFERLDQHPHLAPVLLSDNRETLSAPQDAGCTVVGPAEGLIPATLADLLTMANAMGGLRLSQRQAMQQWEMAEDRFRDMADQFADWLWEIDTALRLTFSSSRKRPAQNATRDMPFTQAFLPEERLRIEDDFADLIRAPRAFHDRDYWAADAYGTRVCWSVSGTPVFTPEGKLTGFRGVARDVSPMKIATDQLYYLTNHDPLTGLANRNRFADELARTLRVAGREGRTGALVLLNLDHFRLINQSHGHAVGDKALVHMTQILKDQVRTNDLVARLDGDMFALILRDIRPEDLPTRMEQLQSTLAARALPLEDLTVTLNMSGGVAFYPAHGDNAEDLYANALDALTRAKQRGPNRIEVYDAATPAHAGASEQLQWMEFLNICLAQPEDRLLLHFQPIIPLLGGDPVEFYEVLLRLRDDAGQAIPAQQYIQVAEAAGFAPRIDRLVISRALSLLAGWIKSGRRVRLSLNVSARSLEDPAFINWLETELATHKLPPAMVVFELTETALLRDLESARALIRVIRSAGAQFALDDCGVGYSSLNYLRELELDYIKIDGTFIRNLHTNPDDQAVVKALISIAKQKNIATIAEMVEHAAALDMIKTLQIDFGQGFYFSPPAPELTRPTGTPANLSGQW